MDRSDGAASRRGVRQEDDRVANRAKRRVMVRFGVDRADKTGFTGNLSDSGMFLKTNAVLAPGSVIQVDMEFPDRSWSLWARVVWAKKVPPQLAHVLDCGMGLCFVDPPADWYDYFDAWKAKNSVG